MAGISEQSEPPVQQEPATLDTTEPVSSNVTNEQIKDDNPAAAPVQTDSGPLEGSDPPPNDGPLDTGPPLVNESVVTDQPVDDKQSKPSTPKNDEEAVACECDGGGGGGAPPPLKKEKNGSARKFRKAVARMTGLHQVFSKRKVTEEEGAEVDQSTIVSETDDSDDNTSELEKGPPDTTAESRPEGETEESSYTQVAKKYMVDCVTCPCWLTYCCAVAIYALCEPIFTGCNRCFCKIGFTLYMCISAYAQVVSRIMVFCGHLSFEGMTKYATTASDDTNEPLMGQP